MNHSLSKYFGAAVLLATTPYLSAASAQQLPPPAAEAPTPRLRPQPKRQARPTATPITNAKTPRSEPAFRILPAPALDTDEPNSALLDKAPSVTDSDDAVIIVPPTTPMIPIPPVRVPQARPAKKPIMRAAKAQTYALRVGGVNIAKLNDAAALRTLRAAHEAKLFSKVELSDGAQRYAVTLKSLGASFPYAKLMGFARAAAARRENIDVPLRYEVDARRAHAALQTLAKKINRIAEPAQLDINAARQVVLHGGDGVEVAVAGSAQRLKRDLELAAVGNSTPRVELVVRRIPAGRKGTTQSTLEQFRHLLAEFSTPYNSRIRGRTTNLRMAARLVNGTIVPAGGVFSTNSAIGPRNAAAGWREAKMFVSGQVVNGVGSGICQCSTTIYNAALLAGLPIVERHPHMFRVDYAPASRDAAIYWGQKDMKFRNTTGGPIYVQTWLEGERFRVRLYGVQAPPSNVRVVSRVLSRSGGTKSEAYRVRETENGVQRERLSRDFYRPHP
ncbi:MAG: hypothetical protein JWN98_2026 [Abditibacteriota bacterium]|nr:hypothetical protein [Abditibacteriota bacterium]